VDGAEEAGDDGAWSGVACDVDGAEEAGDDGAWSGEACDADGPEAGSDDAGSGEPCDAEEAGGGGAGSGEACDADGAEDAGDDGARSGGEFDADRPENAGDGVEPADEVDGADVADVADDPGEPGGCAAGVGNVATMRGSVGGAAGAGRGIRGMRMSSWRRGARTEEAIVGPTIVTAPVEVTTTGVSRTDRLSARAARRSTSRSSATAMRDERAMRARRPPARTARAQRRAAATVTATTREATKATKEAHDREVRPTHSEARRAPRPAATVQAHEAPHARPAARPAADTAHAACRPAATAALMARGSPVVTARSALRWTASPNSVIRRSTASATPRIALPSAPRRPAGRRTTARRGDLPLRGSASAVAGWSPAPESTSAVTAATHTPITPRQSSIVITPHRTLTLSDHRGPGVIGSPRASASPVAVAPSFPEG